MAVLMGDQLREQRQALSDEITSCILNFENATSVIVTSVKVSLKEVTSGGALETTTDTVREVYIGLKL